MDLHRMDHLPTDRRVVPHHRAAAIVPPDMVQARTVRVGIVRLDTVVLPDRL